MFALSLRWGERSSYWERVWVCPGFGLEEWLARLLGGGVGRGYAQYPAFAPDPLLLFLTLQK